MYVREAGRRGIVDQAGVTTQHVAGCQRCAAFVESYRRTPAILRTATDVTLPPDLARTLQAWLHNQRRRDNQGPD